MAALSDKAHRPQLENRFNFHFPFAIRHFPDGDYRCSISNEKCTGPGSLPPGFILAVCNPAAVDWVGARLRGYGPERIASAQQAFGSFRWFLTARTSGDVHVSNKNGLGAPSGVLKIKNNSDLSATPSVGCTLSEKARG